MKKLALTFGLAALASLALVACGGSSSSSTSTPTTAAAHHGSARSSSGGGGASSIVKLAADPSQIAYDHELPVGQCGQRDDRLQQSELRAPARRLRAGPEWQEAGLREDGHRRVKTTLDLSNLKPGSYTFYCSVDSHEAAGMKGTLTVQ